MIVFKMTIIDDRQCDENAYKLDNHNDQIWSFSRWQSLMTVNVMKMLINWITIVIIIMVFTFTAMMMTGLGSWILASSQFTYMFVMLAMQVMNMPINQVMLVLVTLGSPRTRNLPMFQWWRKLIQLIGPSPIWPRLFSLSFSSLYDYFHDKLIQLIGPSPIRPWKIISVENWLSFSILITKLMLFSSKHHYLIIFMTNWSN